MKKKKKKNKMSKGIIALICILGVVLLFAIAFVVLNLFGNGQNLSYH